MVSTIDLESMFGISIVVAPTNMTDGCCLKVRYHEFIGDSEHPQRVEKYKRMWLTQSEVRGLIIALNAFVED